MSCVRSIWNVLAWSPSVRSSVFRIVELVTRARALGERAMSAPVRLRGVAEKLSIPAPGGLSMRLHLSQDLIHSARAKRDSR